MGKVIVVAGEGRAVTRFILSLQLGLRVLRPKAADAAVDAC